MHDRRSAAKVRDLAWIRIAGPNAAFDRVIQFFTAQPNCLCNRFEVMKNFSLTKTKAGKLCGTSEESLVAFALYCAGKVGYFSFDRRADIWVLLSADHVSSPSRFCGASFIWAASNASTSSSRSTTRPPIF